MKTFKQLLEDIEITDSTGKVYSFKRNTLTHTKILLDLNENQI